MTAATRAQYNLSQEVAAEIRGRDINELHAVIAQVLTPDPDWVRASRGALVNLRYDEPRQVSTVALAQREAFNLARRRDSRAAAAQFQGIVNDESLAEAIRGWVRFQLAEYTQLFDGVESQRILGSALKQNPYLPTKPLEGLDYRRLTNVQRGQGTVAAEYLSETYASGNAMLVGLYGLLDGLVFRPESSSAFEQALAQLALHLGFRGQRPESEYGHGPDVLWSLGELRYLVIEAKNGATTTSINKRDVNQLTGSMEWFRSKYDHSCSAVPLLVHPSDQPEEASSPHADTRVMRAKELADMVSAARAFAHAIAGQWPPNAKVVGEQLALHGLDAQQFLQRFAVRVRAPR